MSVCAGTAVLGHSGACVEWSVGKARIGISSAKSSLVPRGEVWNIYAPVSEERGVVAEHMICYTVAFQDVYVDPTA
jgi:hypothetical protein